MWRFCCNVGRKQSKVTEIQRHSNDSADRLHAVSVEPASRPSRNKYNGHATDNPARRHSTPYFEVDLVTGCRPTLGVENIVLPAVAKSLDLVHSRRGSWFHGDKANQRKVTPEENANLLKVKAHATETVLPVETHPYPTSTSTSRKKSGFVKLRSSGSSFRERALLKRSNRCAIPRLNFMSRNRSKDDGGGINTSTQMQKPPPSSSPMIRTSRRDSLYIFSHGDEPIVTPFAQILASLRKVRANFIGLTNVHSSKDLRFGTSQTEESLRIPCPVEDDLRNSLAVETLEELEWCLERLESIQTHRSVSDMASSKFKKMLNKELSQVYDGDKMNSQISEYICTTFLDQDEQTAEGQLAEGGGAGGDDDGKGPLLFAKPPIEAATSLSKDADAVTGGFIDSVGDSEQRTITATSSADFQKSHQRSPDNRADLKTAQMLATVAMSPKKRCGELLLDANRPGDSNRSSIVSLSSFFVPNIICSSSSVTGIGVDPRKVVQFADPSEPPPLYGIIPEHMEELTQILESGLDQWGINIFKLAEYTSNPLTCVTYTILKQRGLINKFKIPHWNLLRYLQSAEAHYNSHTPYHNKIHAADVVQSIHVLLQAPVLDSVFTDLELIAVIIACAIHDVNHPGVTNQYLVNTNDALAILYNDSSVLENYHLSVAFNLLTFPNCDFLVNLPRKQRLTFRRMVIDMVLSTDMSKHMTLLADLKTMVETKQVAGSGILNLDNYTDRMQILQNMVHCADLSNTAKPLDLYSKWMYRLMDEFFLQGDRERAAGLDISPMCDRKTATIEKSQVSFIDFISHPLWETWADLVHPAAQKILELLEYNRDWYFNLIHADDYKLHQHQQQETE